MRTTLDEIAKRAKEIKGMLDDLVIAKALGRSAAHCARLAWSAHTETAALWYDLKKEGEVPNFERIEPDA